jgi:hypothetical protein
MAHPAIDLERVTAVCRHHWVIDAPTGPKSQGRCRLCGAEREFQNYAGDFVWEKDDYVMTPRVVDLRVDSDLDTEFDSD